MSQQTAPLKSNCTQSRLHEVPLLVADHSQEHVDPLPVHATPALPPPPPPPPVHCAGVHDHEPPQRP